MIRREFLAMLGGAAAWPIAARAQQPAMPVIGFLNSASSDGFGGFMRPFRSGLAATGHVEGRNVTIEYRWADGHYDRLPSLATDLVRRQVAVIALFGLPAALAAKAATSKIPIVVATGADPVTTGLVTSMNRPAGNITGISLLSPAMATKQIDLLRELVPKTDVMGILVNPTNPIHESQLRDLQAGAGAVSMKLIVMQASNERGIDEAFEMFARQKAGAIIVPGDPFFADRRDQLVALEMRHTIPTVYESRHFTAVGGLMNYGTSVADVHRQLGVYTGQILKGAKPGDLPFMQPTRFELMINLKTAKALGLEVPTSILLRADEVIE
jgi:putative ABC transport system substrate-binding protein